MNPPRLPALRTLDAAWEEAVAHAWPDIAQHLQQRMQAVLGERLAARLAVSTQEDGVTIAMPSSLIALLGAIEAALVVEQDMIRDQIAQALRQSLEGRGR